MTEERTALYYPTMQLPRGEWLNQALLYWDKIATIVPRKWDDVYQASKRTSMSDSALQAPTTYVYHSNQWHRDRDISNQFLSYKESEELERLNAIRTIRPEILIHGRYNEQNRFDQELISILDSLPQLPRCGQHRPWYHETWIQADKVTDGILEYLQKRKLVCGDPAWEKGLLYHIFERETAEIYMSILARFVADLDSKYTVPYTNYRRYWNLNYSPSGESDKFACANIIMQLPIPKNDVPIEEILNFKKKYHHDLIKLHRYIFNFEKRIKYLSDYSDLEDRCAEDAQEIKNQTIKLFDSFKEEKIGVITGSIRSIVSKEVITNGAIVGGTIGGALSLLIDGSPLNPVIMGAATIAGIIAKGVIIVSDDYTAMKARQSAKLRESSFSYLYHGESSRIISVKT